MSSRCRVDAIAHPGAKDARGRVRCYNLYHRHVSTQHRLQLLSRSNLSRSSQFYFAWQVHGLAQKRFVKYVVSGAVAVLSLLAFGKRTAREKHYQLMESPLLLCLTAGGLGKPETFNGLRLCFDFWL